jgi:hypothetical protein
MNCPKCGLTNPDSAQRCECGYDFAAEAAEDTQLPEAPAPRAKKTTAKQTLARTLQGVAMLAGAIFVLGPFTGSGHWAVFMFACLFVAIICGLLGAHLDENWGPGFWPDKHDR